MGDSHAPRQPQWLVGLVVAPSRHSQSRRAGGDCARLRADGHSSVRRRRPRYLAGVKKPVTVPESVNVPSGLVNVFSSAGSSQVTALRGWCVFAAISVSDSVVPPVGVNENVRLNALGMNIDVLPMTCAGVNSPLPFTDTISCVPPQTAVKTSDFFALTGSADAACARTARMI